MTEFFDGKSARPQIVRVLLLNNQIHIYEEQENNLLYTCNLELCTLQHSGNKLIVYLAADATTFLAFDEPTPVSQLIEEGLSKKDKSYFARLFRMNLATLLLILLLIAGTIFLGITWGVPTIGLKVISIQQEQSYGNSIYQTIAAQNNIDSSNTVLLQAFANKLQLSKNYHLRLIVVKEKDINAFALPGGIIVVNSGILQTMHSYNELAALLGHEVTHVNNRHSLRSILKSMSVNTALSLVLGNASALSSGVANVAANLNSLSYSRSLEAEADKTSVELLAQNHINPNGMVALLQELKNAEKYSPPSFLSSHPATGERIKAAQHAIQALPASNYPDNPELEAIWKKIKATY